MNEPIISVVVCTYDMARYDQLISCLDSLHRQTLRPHEIVVVVDGNAALARRLQDEESSAGLTIVALPENVGLSGARNAGLEKVTTPWSAFLDDDAVADPSWLQALWTAVQESGAYGAGGVSLPLFDTERPSWLPTELLWAVGCSHTDYKGQRVVVRNVFGGCALFRTDMLRLLDGFSAALGRTKGGHEGGEEADLCLRALKIDPDARFVVDPAAVIHHRVPAARARVSYFLVRCLAEGRSKARLASSLGTSGLSAERSFVAATPWRVLWYLAHGQLPRAAVLAAGVVAAAIGYLEEKVLGSRRRVEAVA